MMGNVIEQSLRGPSPLIPAEALIGNGHGSRMPGIVADRLTPAIAQKLADLCPTAALAIQQSGARRCLRLSYGHCIGCGKCIGAGEGAVVAETQFSRCGVAKDQTVRLWDVEGRAELTVPAPAPHHVRGTIHALLQRALNIRQVDAGSCNGCEAEIAALTNPYYDLERFGIHFVASPKHADMLLVTGPVTRNMAEAVKAAYEAVPAPKLVVAVGACGCSGGIFAASHTITGPVDAVVPVDGYIPGCPPTPAMLVTGILEVLRRRLAK
jgi:Ni,Fe-hydrogenase III small subunit